jgi:hypothetical protein
MRRRAEPADEPESEKRRRNHGDANANQSFVRHDGEQGGFPIFAQIGRL